jgi:RNA polymerase sigma factor (sigma-70 family)
MESILDAELVGAARSGNRAAYDELIRRYQRPIYGLACVLLGDRSEAEDITQEAFLRAWLNLDLLSDPGKFAPWVRRIVFGVSIDWLRAFRPDLYRLTDTDTELELFATPSSSESALVTLESIELREKVWQAVAKLPPHYRLPLTLFHLDGLSHAKVAESIGATESTVRSLVTRARRKLEPMLSSYAAEVLPALQDVLEEQGTAKWTMLHITDGQSVAGTLRESAIPGEVLIYGDLMYEGPAPAGLRDEEWWDIRARFLSNTGEFAFEEARRYLGVFEGSLSAISKHDETVLWLDHRLSDQLILIKLLSWFHRAHFGQSQLSLICVGRYPGMDQFVGLGQLTADQLASLADTRSRVSDAQFRLASAAWRAFISSDPSDIERAIERGTSALPFLGAALRRHLEQFPSVENGLSRTERQALSILHENGSLSAIRLFFAVQKMEDPLFMGDTSFLRILRELASSRHALIRIANDGQRESSGPTGGISSSSEVTLTEIGLRVLDGQEDHVRLNGIDRWLGGVRLAGADAAWRWDSDQARLTLRK